MRVVCLSMTERSQQIDGGLQWLGRDAEKWLEASHWLGGELDVVRVEGARGT